MSSKKGTEGLFFNQFHLPVVASSAAGRWMVVPVSVGTAFLSVGGTDRRPEVGNIDLPVQSNESHPRRVDL
jgi:hypothetical protein